MKPFRFGCRCSLDRLSSGAVFHWLSDVAVSACCVAVALRAPMASAPRIRCPAPAAKLALVGRRRILAAVRTSDERRALGGRVHRPGGVDGEPLGRPAEPGTCPTKPPTPNAGGRRPSPAKGSPAARASECAAASRLTNAGCSAPMAVRSLLPRHGVTRRGGRNQIGARAPPRPRWSNGWSDVRRERRWEPAEHAS